MVKIKMLIFVLFPFLLQGQSFTLSTCDNLDQKVAFAHIENLSTGGMAVSNEEGNFEIALKSVNDKVRISHISYKTIEIAASDLNLQKGVCLVEQSYFLSEVTVRAMTEFELLRKAIANTESKQLNAIKLNGYYKEFVTTDGEYTKFCDGAIGYYINKSKDNVEIQGEVFESRAFSLPASDEVDIDLVSPIDFKKSLEYYYPSNIGRFIKSGADKNYVYELLESEGEFLIKSMPQEDSEVYYSGLVSINKSDTTITKVSFTIVPERSHLVKTINAVVVKLDFTTVDANVIYAKSKTGYIYPLYLRLNFGVHLYNKKSFDQNNTFISDLQIYEVPQDQSPIAKSEVFRKKSLYKRETEYKSEYWKNRNLIFLTAAELKIISGFDN
jgi:hypothetical protein